MKCLKPLMTGIGALVLLGVASPCLAQDYHDEEDSEEGSDGSESDAEQSEESSSAEAESSASAEASGSASLSSSGVSGMMNQAGGGEAGSGGTGVPAPGGTDHARFAGTFGIGYLGYRTMAIGVDPGDPDDVGSVEAPVVGVRYWMNQDMGLDLGLGLVMASRSTETGDTDADDPQPFGMIIHAGVPLALTSSQHFVFQIVPEMNIGFASNTVEVGTEELEQSGFHLDIGARAGGEIHFGFIDVPELALQAGIGLRYAMDNTSAEIDSMNSSSASSSRLETTVGENPWNIFFANIAAIYYFGG